MNNMEKNPDFTSNGSQVGNCIALAEQIARKAHDKQFRRDGVTPYITHPEAVAKKLHNEDDNTIAAAWLHDVLEDTSETPDSLRDAGIPEEVITAVQKLTSKNGEPYEDYLEVLKANTIARKVKVADMLHNLSDEPTTKQILKYANGLVKLLG